MFSIITGPARTINVKVWVCAAALGLIAGGCDKLPLLAPQESTITLSTNSRIVQANGSAQIRATVLEQAGTPVQNGTTVTFITNLGTLSPTDARTVNGVATVQFVANGQSGTAEISAISGGAKAEPIQLAVGSAAAGRVIVTANPNQIPAGGASTITATVTDTNGNPLNGVQVAFSTDAGTISSALTTTNFSGQAQVTLTTSRDATVTATTGSTSSGTGGSTTVGASGSVKVTVSTSPDIAIAASASPTEDQPVNFTVTVSGTGSESLRAIVVDFGDGTTSGELSGTTQGVSHVYRSSGTFTVTATGTTPSGNTKVATTVITVAPRVPVNFTITASPNPTAVNTVTTLSVTFENTNPTNVTRYEWSFGDGTSATTTGRQISHVYKTAGTRTARVTVRTNDGNSATSQTQVIVNP